MLTFYVGYASSLSALPADFTDDNHDAYPTGTETLDEFRYDEVRCCESLGLCPKHRK